MHRALPAVSSTDPPAPAVGIRNALASSPTSSNISQHAASSYHLSAANTALQFPSSGPVVTAHAAGSHDLFATVVNQILVFTDVPAQITASSPARLHIEAQGLGVARLSAGEAVAAVAGYDGVFLSRLVGRHVTMPVPLPGSSGYACVAVAVSDDGAVAAGSMAGQVALWPSAEGPASAIVDVPEGVDSCDRVTQVRFVPGGILVAWWSGLLLRYAIHEEDVSLVWRMNDAKRGVTDFCEVAGTFFAVGNGANDGRAILTRGDAAIFFIDLASGKNVSRKVRSPTGQVFVKGLCVTADGTFLWIRDARQLLQIHWPETKSSDDKTNASDTQNSS